MHQQLDDDGDPDVAHLVVLQLVDLLCDQGVYGGLKLGLFLALLLGHVLALEVDAVADEGGPLLEGLGEFSADFLGDEGDEIFDRDPQFLNQLGAGVDGGVAVLEEAVEGAEPDVVEGLDVEVGLDQDELLQVLEDGERQQGQDLLELEVVVGGGGLVVEVDEHELLPGPFSMHAYSGRKLRRKEKVRSEVPVPGCGCRYP